MTYSQHAKTWVSKQKVIKISWKNNYDKCMMDNQGDLIIFGEHYSLKECRKIIEEENYDEPTDWSYPEHIFIKFGFVNFEGEITNGFIEHNEYKKGRIKATILKQTEVTGDSAQR